MDVIQYLIEDDNNIEDRLQKLTDNYSEWPRDRSFEETKKVLNMIGIHLGKKETLLTNNLKSNDGIEPVLEKSVHERDAINNEIDNLTQLHVDEVGFFSGLKALLSKVTEHRKFCIEEFYPQMQAHLTADDFVHIEQQLDQMVLS